MDYNQLPEISKEELVEAAFCILGGNVADARPDQLARWMTITSYAFDICLNEFERRGHLQSESGMPIIPYCSEHAVETVLTRR